MTEEIQGTRRFKKTDAVLVFVGILILVGITKLVGFKNLVDMIAGLRFEYLLLFFVLKSGYILIWTYKLKILIDSVKKVSFISLIPLTLTGTLFNSLTPGPKVGGEPVKAYYLSKMLKKPVSASLAIILTDGIILAISMLGFLFASLFYVVLYINAPRLNMLAKNFLIFIFALIFIIGYFIVRRDLLKGQGDALLYKLFRSRLLSFFTKRFKNITAFKKFFNKNLQRFKSTSKKLLMKKSLLAWSTFLSICMYVLDCLTLMAILLGIGVHLPVSHVIAAMTLAWLLGYYVLVPGGVGVVEAGLIGILHAMGLGWEAATAAAFLNRFFQYFVAYVIGYIGFSYLRFKYK